MNMDMLLFGRGGAINTERVVLIANARSSPIKRLIKTINSERIFDLTYGSPCETVILFENGCIALVHRTPGEVVRALTRASETDHDIPPWW